MFKFNNLFFLFLVVFSTNKPYSFLEKAALSGDIEHVSLYLNSLDKHSSHNRAEVTAALNALDIEINNLSFFTTGIRDLTYTAKHLGKAALWIVGGAATEGALATFFTDKDLGIDIPVRQWRIKEWSKAAATFSPVAVGAAMGLRNIITGLNGCISRRASRNYINKLIATKKQLKEFLHD